jgi:hypothetical protein
VASSARPASSREAATNRHRWAVSTVSPCLCCDMIKCSILYKIQIGSLICVFSSGHELCEQFHLAAPPASEVMKSSSAFSRSPVSLPSALPPPPQPCTRNQGESQERQDESMQGGRQARRKRSQGLVGKRYLASSTSSLASIRRRHARQPSRG